MLGSDRWLPGFMALRVRILLIGAAAIGLAGIVGAVIASGGSDPDLDLTRTRV